MGTRRRFTDEFKREAIRLAGSLEQYKGGQWQMAPKRAINYLT